MEGVCFSVFERGIGERVLSWEGKMIESQGTGKEILNMLRIRSSLEGVPPTLASLGWELLQALISVIAMLFRHQALFWVLYEC